MLRCLFGRVGLQCYGVAAARIASAQQSTIHVLFYSTFIGLIYVPVCAPLLFRSGCLQSRAMCHFYWCMFHSLC